MNTVTGAFGYTGSYITKQLLDTGAEVSTLTNSPDKKSAEDPDIAIHPFHFNDPTSLQESLQNTKILFNTYWIRFEYSDRTFQQTVENSRILFESARAAGVEKIVHISITNPSLDSDLPYFRGKAQVEEILKDSGLAYSILRPALLFSAKSILVNNIAWTLRRFPVFGMFGDGKYQMQPIHVDDLASLAVQEAGIKENKIINAIGPETFTFEQFVKTIGDAIDKKKPIIPVPPWSAQIISKGAQPFLDDVLITKDEVKGLMRGLLYVNDAPVGSTFFTEWVKTHRSQLGKQYESELARR